MIPYLFAERFNIFGISVFIWGLFVSLGLFFGLIVSLYRAKKKGISLNEILNLTFWFLLAAFVGGRAFFFLLNSENGKGFSSAGAIVSGTVMVLIVLRKKGMFFFRSLVDIVAPGLLLSEAVGRIGCFLLHEHIGRRTNFFLGVSVGGVSRHDLGLYFFLSALTGFLFFSTIEKKYIHESGQFGALIVGYYFFYRFLLEFLYESAGNFSVDRYHGLTLMQFFSIIAIVLLVLLRINKFKHIVQKIST